MPIRIPDTLPARPILEKEGVDVMGEDTANRQDIRPLRIGLLNLMPNKIRTETQFARLIGATPLQVELHLIKLLSHTPKNTPADHMISFYEDWPSIKHDKFDGLIITGAPVETMPFEDVRYWQELCEIFDWTQTHVHSTFNICWAAQAAMYHFHKVPKHPLERKAFGVFHHKILKPSAAILRGLSDDVAIPVSRWTENHSSEIPQNKGLEILMESKDSGLCMVEDKPHRMLNMFNHVEYDNSSLAEEYFRDVKAGKEIALPKNYFEDDDPTHPPKNIWRSHAHLLFGNWINEVYQTTPFNLKNIGL